MMSVQRLVDRLRDTNATNIMVGLMFCGVALIALSFVLGVASVPTDVCGTIVREVGFAASWNWSITYPLLLPVAAYFMVTSLCNIRRTIEALDGRRMIVDTTTLGSGRQALEAGCAALEPFTRRAIVAGLLFAAVVSLTEWVTGNAVPLYRLRHATDPLQAISRRCPEVGWGQAALLPGELLAQLNGGWALNALFNLLAFIMQALLIAALIAFFFLLYDFRKTLERQRTITLIPDLTDPDPRRGFSLFGRILTPMLVVSLMTFVICYLSRLHNLYLRSGLHDSPGAFVRDDLALGVQLIKIDGNLPGLNAAPLFNTALRDDFTGYMVVLAMFIATVLSFSFVASVLRQAAEDGREWLRAQLISLPEHSTYRGLTCQEALSRLESMTVWPMRYPDFNTLLAFCLFAAASLVFHRLIISVLGAAILFALYRVVRALSHTLRGQA